MEEKLDMINEEVLEEVAGGAGAEKKHAQIINCKHCVNVRSTPDSKTDDNKIGHAYLGDKYVFYGWTGNWAKVQFGSRKAYIYKTFIKLA